MPLLESNLWSGTDPRLQQQSYGGQFPGMMAGQGQVPQLPQTLAGRLAQRAQMRMSPQTNPLIAATMAPQKSMGMEMMPPFQPSELPKPKEFWEQQFQPSEGMRSMSVTDSMPKESGVAMPGQLPQVGGPQIPNNMQGMGLGANAPQTMGGLTPQMTEALKNVPNAYQPNPVTMGLAGAPKQEDGMNKFGLDMFDIYKNLYGGQ